jgi:hypothetical protein
LSRSRKPQCPSPPSPQEKKVEKLKAATERNLNMDYDTEQKIVAAVQAAEDASAMLAVLCDSFQGRMQVSYRS